MREADSTWTSAPKNRSATTGSTSKAREPKPWNPDTRSNRPGISKGSNRDSGGKEIASSRPRTSSPSTRDGSRATGSPMSRTGSTRGRSRSGSRATRRSRAARRWSTTPTCRSSAGASSGGRLRSAGSSEITVLLSHWHLDHVAGNEAFARLRDPRDRPHRRAARGQPGRDRGRDAGGAAADRPAGPADAGVLGRGAPRPRRHRGRADRGQHPQRRRGGDLAARAAPAPLRGHDGGHDHLRR